MKLKACDDMGFVTSIANLSMIINKAARQSGPLISHLVNWNYIFLCYFWLASTGQADAQQRHTHCCHVANRVAKFSIRKLHWHSFNTACLSKSLAVFNTTWPSKEFLLKLLGPRQQHSLVFNSHLPKEIWYHRSGLYLFSQMRTIPGNRVCLNQVAYISGTLKINAFNR